MTTHIKCPRCGARYAQSETTATFCPQCAFAAAITAPQEVEIQANALLGRLPGLGQVEKLGRGGMGVVYRARQTRLERDVAVKVISSDLAADPDFQRRFAQEAQILASLDHPNIVAIHDYGIEGALEYFVMEYVEGESVRGLLERDALAEPMRVALDVAEALAYAHESGVIHRDIKPENVLVRRDGRVKVVDFGIARLGHGAPGLTGTDMVVGTPAYMAPEQRENPSAVDHRVDVYALGLLMREMMTGEGPATGPIAVQGLDDATAQVILRAVERDPARRFQTMREMASAIRSIVEPASEGVVRLPWRERVARLAASRLFWVLATGAAFQVLFLVNRIADTLPPDPKAEFERVVSEKGFQRSDAARALGDHRIQDEVDALLAAEAGSSDRNRAWLAVRVACDLGRQERIPPDVRARAILRYDGKLEPLRWDDLSMTDPKEVLESAVPVVLAAGPSFASELFGELISGRIPDERREIAICALGMGAHPDLLRKMRDFLLSHPTDPRASDILVAFAARTDLPAPGRAGDESVRQDILPIYLKHLPKLLDEATAEVDWSRAVELARELQQLLGVQGFDEASWCTEWMCAHKAEVRATGLPQEMIARELGVTWPITPDAARLLELRLRTEERPMSMLHEAYPLALLLTWRRTGRTTLPHRSLLPMGAWAYAKHTYDVEAARSILVEPPEEARWEVHGLLSLTVAGAPIEMGCIEGTGPVVARRTRELPAEAQPASLRVGISTVRATPKTKAGGMLEVSVEGGLERGEGDTWRLQGTCSERRGGGRGWQSVGMDCRAGDATVVMVQGDQVNDPRSWLFLLLVPEPSAVGDAPQRWRTAAASAIAHAASAKEENQSGRLRSLVALAAWTPLPEAAETLSELWKKRSDLIGFGDENFVQARQGDLVGAALLLIGDVQPLEDMGLIRRLPLEVVLRIRLFSSSAAIRRAAVGGEAAIKTPMDADAVEKRLGELGEEDAALSARIASVRAEEPSMFVEDFWKFLALIVVALVLGCVVPWRRPRTATIAHGLVFAGLLFRFVTLEVAGRAWFPALGDLLILVAAVLHGGWVFRAFALAMAVGGVLGFMVPGAFRVECLSGHFLCVYVAVMSLDFLARRLPGRVGRIDALALCATWWLLVVPIGILYTSLLVLLLWRDSVEITLFTLSRDWAWWYFAAMIAGPLLIARANRVAA